MNTIDSALTNTLMMSFHSDNIILKMFYNTLILGIVAYIGKLVPSVLEYLKLYMFTVNNYTSIHYTSINSANNNINRSTGFIAWLEYYNTERLKNALTTNEKYNVKELQGGYTLDNKYQPAILIPDNAYAYKINDFIYFTYWQEKLQNNSSTCSIDHIIISTDYKNKKRLINLDLELYTQHQLKQSSIYNTIPHIFTFLSYTNGKTQWQIREFTSYRTIDHMWFNEKAIFIEKYNMFLNSKEDYIKRGEPWTFSCLLHGTPGCGKTSLLKSIVNMDKKNGKISHLFVIPFDKIEDSETFSSIILGGTPENISIPYNQRIYVFEDFDACRYSNIFLKRDGITMETKDELDNESDNDESNDESENESNQQDKTILEQPKLTPIQFHQIRQIFPSFNLKRETFIPHKNEKEKKNKSFLKKEVTINLSDILNTLDGLIERTGQRIFWTTNKNIDIFDPAFLRPGRMDMIIEFTSCNTKGATYLLEKYYNKNMDPSFKLKHSITPAKLKELCRSSTTIEQCIEKINLL